MWGVTTIFGWLQNRWSFGNGSSGKTFEHRAAKLAGVEAVEQVLLDEMDAPTQMDDAGTIGKLREQRTAKNAARSIGQGEEVDEDLGLPQEVGLPLRAGETLDSRQMLLCPAPTDRPVPNCGQFPRGVATEIAQPHDADGARGGMNCR